MVKKNFWEIVNKVLEKSNIILEVLDARFIEETRNKEIEEKVKKTNKILIYVINKSDLVEKKRLEKIKLKPSVYVSSKNRFGTTKLLHTILRYAKKEDNIVGVLGYPNTGKSSVINALKGRSSASTSSFSGHTKGEQIIRINKKILLLDTPGVLPYKEKDKIKHVLIASLNPSQIKDPESAVIKLMQKFNGVIENYYNIKIRKDYEKSIEEIAFKNKKLKKGNLPDVDTMSRIILQDWQKGKIKL